MEAITLTIPDELARQLRPYQADLLDILSVGLREWETAKRKAVPTQRERILEALQGTDLIQPLELAIARKYLNSRPHQRQKPLKLGGKPLSQIIIKQRGTLCCQNQGHLRPTFSIAAPWSSAT